MTRDEILAKIEVLCADPDSGTPSLATISVRMSEVVQAADTYLDSEADRQYLAEALRDALNSFSEMIEMHAL